MKKIVGFCFKIFVLFVFVFLLCFFVYIKSFELSPKLKIVSKSVLNVSKKIETKYIFYNDE